MTILDLLRERPIGCFEMAEALRWPLAEVSAALVILEAQGLIRYCYARRWWEAT